MGRASHPVPRPYPGPVEGPAVSFPPPAPPTGPSGPDGPSGPGGLDPQTRGWGVAAHLSAFVGAWLLVAFVGPLVVYLVGRDRHPSVAHHAREALNFNLTFLLVLIVGGIVGFVLAVVTLGLGLLVLAPLGGAVVLVWVILVIVAAVKAWDGEPYRYPLTLRFVR